MSREGKWSISASDGATAAKRRNRNYWQPQLWSLTQCMHFAHVLRSQQEARGRAHHSWIDRVCPCVQRSSAQVARHAQSGRLTQQLVCARSTRKQILCVHMVRISYVHGVIRSIHSSSYSFCLGTSALLLVSSCRIIFINPSLEILCFNLMLMDRFAIQFQCCRGVQGQIKRCQNFLNVHFTGRSKYFKLGIFLLPEYWLASRYCFLQYLTFWLVPLFPLEWLH